MAKNDFQYGTYNSYTLQCGMLVKHISILYHFKPPLAFHLFVCLCVCLSVHMSPNLEKCSFLKQ